MPSTGAIFSEVTFFTPPFVPTVTTANEGTSLSGTTVQLGQAVGAAGDPAQITADREIPMDIFTNIVIDHQALTPAQLSLNISPFNIQWDFDATLGLQPTFQMRDVASGSSWSVQYLPAPLDVWNTGFGGNLAIQERTIISLSGLTGPATAQLQLGTASGGVGQGQLKFTGPSILAVPEQGVMEFNNTNLFFTRVAGTRESVHTGNAGAAAPALALAIAPVNVYGVANGNYLGDPNNWTDVNIGGVNFKIPLYL